MLRALLFHVSSCIFPFSRNLLFLKNYSGNVEELSLNFTVVNNDLGESQVKEKCEKSKISFTQEKTCVIIECIYSANTKKSVKAWKVSAY